MTTPTTQQARDFRGTHTAGRTPEELRELVSHVGAELELAPAETSSSGRSPPSATASAITSSMGDAVLAHLASKVAPGVDVVFLDTGYHFAETIGTRDAVEATLDVNLVDDHRRSRAWPSRTRRTARTCTRPTPTCAARCARCSRWPTSLEQVRRLGHRPAPRRDPQPGDRAGHRLGRQQGQGQGLAPGPLVRRAGRAVHRRERRAGEPARATTATPPSGAGRARGASRRARTRAAGAGPAPTRPSAGSTQ